MVEILQVTLLPLFSTIICSYTSDVIMQLIELDDLPNVTFPFCDSVSTAKQNLPSTTTINGVHDYIYIITGTE